VTTRIDALLEQARQLSPEERALLLDRLQDLLNPPDSGWETAWARECERRLGAYERGETTAEDFATALERLREKFRPQ
jgi:putative addiction module component (TIGR02574 family)